jgi:hypothetical protein
MLDNAAAAGGFRGPAGQACLSGRHAGAASRCSTGNCGEPADPGKRRPARLATFRLACSSATGDRGSLRRNRAAMRLRCVRFTGRAMFAGAGAPNVIFRLVTSCCEHQARLVTDDAHIDPQSAAFFSSGIF